MTISEKVIKLPWYKKIEILRVINDWKQREVAEKCGVDQKIYWNWENGASVPIKRNREIIAKVFNVSESDIGLATLFWTNLYRT